jgi:hypothetical protein
MSTTSRLAALTLLSALAAACAPAPKRQAAWYTASGELADRKAVRAAADRCEPKVARPTRPGIFRGTVEWGIAMLDCLREEGFVLVYEDPAEIAPAEPED